VNRTQLLRAAVVLAAVVFLWGVAEMLGGHSGEPAPSMALTPPIGADVLDTVTMSGPTDTIRLVRGTGGWTVNGYPADSAVLASFVTRDASTRPHSSAVRGMTACIS
jgi:hypothetical protein